MDHVCESCGAVGMQGMYGIGPCQKCGHKKQRPTPKQVAPDCIKCGEALEDSRIWCSKCGARQVLLSLFDQCALAFFVFCVIAAILGWLLEWYICLFPALIGLCLLGAIYFEVKGSPKN